MTATAAPIAPADDEDPAYVAYCEAMDERARVAAGRRVADAPHPWGHRLDAAHYFCLTCWLDGEPNGEHPDDMPPCDPPARVPSWA